MGCHFLLQEIFPTQGSNPCLLHLLHWQADSLHISIYISAFIYFMLDLAVLGLRGCAQAVSSFGGSELLLVAVWGFS